MEVKKIIEKLEELEKKARENREKNDEFSLTDYLEDEDKEKYERLLQEYNSIKVKPKDL